MVIDETARERLAAFLCNAAAARSVHINNIELLTGGTLQENFLLDLCFDGGPESGKGRYVLRVTRPGSIEGSLSRVQEFAIMQAVRQNGVMVPEPLWLADDPDILGADFLVMRFVPGTASPQRIIRDRRWGPGREALAERIGMEVAQIQRVKPGFPGLDFLAVPDKGAAIGLIRYLRLYLDRGATPRPAIEWCLRWLEMNAPPARDLVLTHGDFRTGNYMVDDRGLTGILDWELAAWGDPLLDLGWFCMRFWRFGNPTAEAGGIAARRHLWRGYEAATAQRICPDEALYWEIMANTRWAVLSIQQAARHLDGSLTSLELALTGRCTAEMEYEALRLISLA